MASRPIDARGWIFEVRDAEATTETWLPIGLLTSWNRNESENEETADTTTNDSEGYYSQDVMQRGATIEVEGLYAQVTSGTPTPGRRTSTTNGPTASAPTPKTRSVGGTRRRAYGSSGTRP